MFPLAMGATYSKMSTKVRIAHNLESLRFDNDAIDAEAAILLCLGSVPLHSTFLVSDCVC